MAISIPVERYAQSLAAQGASSAISPATEIPAGGMAFLFITMGGAKAVTGVTDSVASPWTVDAQFASGGPAVAVCSCQLPNAIGTDAVITPTYSPSTSSAHQFWILEVLGLATSAAFDKTESDTQIDAAPASGALATLSQADEIIFNLFRTNTPSTATKGANLTNIATPTLGSPPSGLAYAIVAATTGINTGWTLGTAGSWADIAVSYKGAAAATFIPKVILF